MLSAPSIAAASSGVSLPCDFDRSQDRLLALGQHSQAADAALDLPDLLFIEPAGLVFAIAGDEGDRVAGVEQTHHAFDLHQRQGDAVGNGAKIDSSGQTHAQTQRPLIANNPNRIHQPLNWKPLARKIVPPHRQPTANDGRPHARPLDASSRSQ